MKITGTEAAGTLSSVRYNSLWGGERMGEGRHSPGCICVSKSGSGPLHDLLREAKRSKGKKSLTDSPSSSRGHAL